MVLPSFARIDGREQPSGAEWQGPLWPRIGIGPAEDSSGWPSSPLPPRHSGHLEMVLGVALAVRFSHSSAGGMSSFASLENAVSALRIAPSLVAKASTVLRDGTSTSNAYHIVLLPACQSTRPLRSLS